MQRRCVIGLKIHNLEELVMGRRSPSEKPKNFQRVVCDYLGPCYHKKKDVTEIAKAALSDHVHCLSSRLVCLPYFF